VSARVPGQFPGAERLFGCAPINIWLRTAVFVCCRRRIWYADGVHSIEWPRWATRTAQTWRRVVISEFESKQIDRKRSTNRSLSPIAVM
jgi:hypothetical protein